MSVLFININSARIKESHEPSFLCPKIDLLDTLMRPGWTSSKAETLEGILAIAVAKATKLDGKRGETFISDPANPPYQLNSPWNFSPKLHA